MPDETSGTEPVEPTAGFGVTVTAPGEEDDFPLALLYKKTTGVPLTLEEVTVWNAHVERQNEAERERELLGLVDLAEVMRDGATEPEMLVEGLLVEGEHHLWYGNKESAKTWLALWASAWVMGNGGVVVWVDKEMGRKNLANRMLTLKVPEQAVGERFVYCEFPTLDCSKRSTVLWKALLQAKQPALVVVDAQTEVLADADLNENSGTDIEKWMKAYVTPARRVGCATLMLDHTGHTEAGRSVGSRQKGAAAKVELSVVKKARFDDKQIGSVEVTRTKNTVAAPIDETQHFRIGGDGQGGFTLERADLPARPKSLDADDDARAKLLDALGVAGAHGLTVTDAMKKTRGAKKTVKDRLTELEADPTTGVKVRPGLRPGSERYYVAEPEVQ
jgi:hypothetical protein